MKILVTGATGLLGHHLCRSLIERGHHITALRRGTSDISLLAGLDLDFALGDVTDLSSLEAAARGQEAVIHAAAHLAYSSRQRATQNQVNIEGTRNVVAASQQAGDTEDGNGVAASFHNRQGMRATKRPSLSAYVL